MSMFNWSGKQAIGDGDEPSPALKNIPSSTERKTPSFGDLESFDHSFKGQIHTIYGSHPKLSVFGNCSNEKRTIKTICSSNTFEIIEEVSISQVNKSLITYRLITGIAWDHASGEVKIELESPEDFAILTMANSVDFERELRLRFVKTASKDGKWKIPTPMYVGIFAGANKPKPFQRKRPNISNLPLGKLPGLREMRSAAIELKHGSYKAVEAGSSRRWMLANQHIYEGFNTFKLIAVRGNRSVAGSFIKGTSLLFVLEDKLVFRPQGVQGTNVEFSYEDISIWTVIDNEGKSGAVDSGIEIEGIESGEKVYFGVNFIRDLKHTLEFYWNKYQTSIGRGPILGSTHGRPLVTVSTLSGEVPASSIPEGSSEVVDTDGILVRPGGKMAIRNTNVSAIKGMIGTAEEQRYVPNYNPIVSKHWNKVVLHQGWLLKQGGAGVGYLKGWIKRYFVLYRTSQGHFLIYYSDFTECPLYSAERNARNIVDLAKITHIRPGTEDADAPSHSFDIVTIEREWTLCAETNDNLQKWMRVLTHAVNEDVAILPDEEIKFMVKPKQDPSGTFNQQDYSTALKISAHGVSVCTPTQSGAVSTMQTSPEREVLFWVYTDFFKWSLVLQNEKPAISVTVFTDSTFTKKVEYQFRHKDAAKIASAIEYFIEKFMSVMHIRLELTDPEAASEPPTHSLTSPTRNTTGTHKAIHEVTDLLGFDDDFAAATISETSKPTTVEYTPSVFGADPFGSTDNLAVAAVETSASVIPFATVLVDPYTMEPKVTASTHVSILPPLSSEQLQQQKAWWVAAISNEGGPVYDDGIVQVASKVEIRGSQCRLTLFLRNSSESGITALKTSVEDPLSMLRLEVGALPSELESRGQAQQQIMLECIKAVHPGASLTIEYLNANNTKRVSVFELPLTVTSFDEPLALSAADFLVRWNALASPEQESVQTFPATNMTPTIAHMVLTSLCKFSYVEGVVEPAIGVCGAATLRMGSTTLGEKVNVGCLLKLELSGDQVRVSARTTSALASVALVPLVKEYLLQEP